MHVAVVDVPTVGPFGVTAAGKLGHTALKRGTWRKATPERDSAPVVPLFGVAVTALAPGAGRTGGAFRAT
jgi:hypothetical protein